MQSREVMQIALVTIVQQQTGGNTAEILDQVAANVRGRFELRRLVRTLTAQGRVSRWVVTALPIGLFLLIYAINPSYTSPLLHTTLGQVLMVLSAGMTVLGSFAISKIVNIEI
jgi:tight adherence protein B